MPYTIRKSGCSSSKPYGVYKNSDGKRMGCHASRAAAAKQIAAIEANEGKEMSETTNTIALDPTTLEARVEKSEEDKKKEWVPYGVISFAELEKQKRAEMVAWEAQDLADTFSSLVYNIVSAPEIDREKAMNDLVAEFQMKMEELNKIQHGMVKEVDGADNEQKENVPDSPRALKSDLTVWKDDSGVYRWMTIYSNNYRDSDRVPEIISEKSHRSFEALVDKEIVPPPELWLWHIPGTKWGQADMVTYSDGFSLAFGTVLPGYEHIAKGLQKAIDNGDDIAVSHGMPGEFIVRNVEDPTIIDFHITKEISVLPRKSAANKLTGFVVFKEEGEEMSIPVEKKEWLVANGLLDLETIEKLESGLAKQSAAADEAGIESKESEEVEDETPAAKEETKEEITGGKEEAPVETPEAKVEEEDEEETKDTETPAEPKPLSRDEIAEAMKAVVTLVQESSKELNSRLSDIEAQMKELQVADTEKVKERVREIPSDSVLDLMRMSIIGQDDAAVDGRTKLAKEGPEETEPSAPSRTPSPFLDGLMSGKKVSEDA